MSPQELELHIQHCGKLMQAAMADYEASGCFSDRGEADAWRLRMEAAIKARTPETVAAMETERGLV